MAYFQQEFIDEVLDRNDIVDVISGYIGLQKKGGNFWGLCPFHGEKTASFSVNPSQQFYHCFGCHAGGDVISFVKHMERLDFSETVAFLAERARIPVPTTSKRSNDIASDQKAKMYSLMTEAARYYYHNLIDEQGKKAHSYLDGRGMSSSIIRRFGLGYSLDDWNGLRNYLIEKGADEEMLLAIGLTKQKNDKHYDTFRNRIMFPIIDKRGRVIAFGGRVMDDSQPKYLNSPDTPLFNKRYNLFGINYIHKLSKISNIIVVEGYMDVIALHQCGITNVVASLGTALTQEQSKLIKRYTNEVYICYDGDKAGQAATLKALDVLYAQGLSPKVISLPTGVDPDDYAKKHGLMGFEDKIREAVPIFDYKISSIESQYDMKDEQQRKQFLEECCRSVLAQIHSPIELSMYVNRLHNMTGVSKTAIEAETQIAQKALGKMNRAAIRRDNNVEQSNIERNDSTGSANNNEKSIRAQRILLQLAIIDIECRSYMHQSLTIDQFTGKERQHIAQTILEQDSKQMTIGRFMSLVDTKCYSELGIESIDNIKDNIESASECVQAIHIASLQKKRREIIMMIESKDIDKNSRIQYMNQLQDIDNQIKQPNTKGEV